MIAKGKCYILMEAVRGAILLKHISLAFVTLFSITSEVGRHIDSNLCNIYVRTQSYKLLSVSKSTVIEYSDFYPFKGVYFLQLIILNPKAPFVIGSMKMSTPKHLSGMYKYGQVRDAEEVITALSLLYV